MSELNHLDDLLAQKTGTIRLGSMVLREIQHICRMFNLSRLSAMRLCHVLHIPLIHINKNAFFQEAAFNRIIYTLTRYGGPGFCCPGSDFKNRQKYKNPHLGNPLVSISSDFSDLAADPAMLSEMAAAADPKKHKVSTSDSERLKTLISNVNSKQKISHAMTPQEENGIPTSS